MAFYIQTNVSIKMGKNQEYNEMMVKLAEFMGRHGWTLKLALQPYIGELTRITHIWEVETFEDVKRALDACWTLPEGHEILIPIPELVNAEAMEISVKTPYSP